MYVYMYMYMYVYMYMYMYRYIYIQAFWSLLWNHMASIFVQVHGLREVKTGDLVLVSSSREGKDKGGEYGKKIDTVHHVTAREARKGVYKVTDVFPILKKN